MTWRLTRDAERDLDEMVSFGAREYGLEAALTCYDELAEKFELLATFPLIGRERETSTRTVRIMRFKAPCDLRPRGAGRTGPARPSRQR